jgi:hypothetical protein
VATRLDVAQFLPGLSRFVTSACELDLLRGHSSSLQGVIGVVERRQTIEA